MLLAFRCENFRSIKEEQELSMVAVKTKAQEHEESLLSTPLADVRVLRCVGLYGANASGKTNILRAMRAFSDMVDDSQRAWSPTGGIPTYDPFAFDKDCRQKPTRFEVDVSLGGSIYRYAFRYDGSTILDERLLDVTGSERILFIRHTEDGKVTVKFPGRNLGATANDRSKLESISSLTRANSLFLSAAAQGNHERLLVLFKWIADSFYILSPRDHRPAQFTAKLCTDQLSKEQIRSLLAFADTGIVDLEIGKEEAPAKVRRMWDALQKAMREVDPEIAPSLDSTPDISRHRITMIHQGGRGNRYPLDFDEESAGTKAYFYMLGPLLNELREGTTVLIDELESSLHPLLARQLVRIFMEPVFNPNGAQLVFATHDVNLLDLSLLRRDEVWFAQKGDEGATEFSMLADYKPRLGQDVASAYLHGRFGAVPFLDEALLRGAFGTRSDLSEPAETL